VPKRDRLRTEREHHKQAFEIYYGLGPKRTYQQVATQLGVSVSAVRLMARSFDWGQRLHDRDAQVTRGAADKAIRSGIDRRSRNLKIVEGGLLRLAKDIKEGRIKGQLSDVDRLIRLEEFLLGGKAELTLDALRQYTFEEVFAFVLEWFRTLSEQEREVHIETVERWEKSFPDEETHDAPDRSVTTAEPKGDPRAQT
jgi:hypothetical protein